MFDVPPPFESRGLKAYEETWRLFYSSQPEPVAFDIKRMEIGGRRRGVRVSTYAMCRDWGEWAKAAT
jgi:hypothetical protein